MSVDSTLDTALTILLGKAGGSGAGGTTIPTGGGGVVVPSSGTGLSTVTVSFNGGGFPLPTAGGLPGIVEIPGPLTLVWVHMFAGAEDGAPVAVTATVDLRLTSEGSFGGASPIYGTVLPRLQSDAVASIDIGGWRRNYNTGDAIIYRLASFSGFATWLTLTMQMRPTVTVLGQNTLIDNSGVTVVDSAGNPLVTRS